MEEKKIQIEHVSDFIRHVEKVTEGYRKSHTILYRGENKTGYTLIPSVYRRIEIDPFSTNTYLTENSERGLIQDFMANAVSYINTLSLDNRFDWIEYAQHFGVPTRLLDWTSNPLVALYFACFPGNEEDGKVYLLHPTFWEQIVMKNDKNQMVGKTIREETVKMIWGSEKGFPYPMAFKPYYIDQRMRAQSSWFMVWGNRTEPLDVLVEELEKEAKGHAWYRNLLEDGVTEYGEREDTALSYVIIPGKKKRILLHELDRLGINQATIFPGLDGIGKAIEWRNNAGNLDVLEWI